MLGFMKEEAMTNLADSSLPGVSATPLASRSGHHAHDGTEAWTACKEGQGQ